jgi:hypothetical protein
VADFATLMRRPLTPQQKADVEAILQEAAKTDELLRIGLARRCHRGIDCDRGDFDPPDRCATCDRSLR